MQKLAANSEKDNLFTLWEQQQERVLPVGPQLEPWATPVFTTLCLFVNDYEIVRIDLAIRNKFEVKWSESCSVVSISLQLRGVGSLSLLQGIFPTHGLNLGLPHCRWILYQHNERFHAFVLKLVNAARDDVDQNVRVFDDLVSLSKIFFSHVIKRWLSGEECII